MADFTGTVEWNEHEISMPFTANMVWDDYGVQGSPRWLSPDNVQWGNYEVDGAEFTAVQLLEQFGKAAVDEIDALLEATLEEAVWEEYEPEYDDCREYDEY